MANTAFLSNRTRSRSFNRSGISLLEVLLALSLIVIITGLIGGLIQLYIFNIDEAKGNVTQARVARAVLNMIADDIRGVVRVNENNDQATLEQFLMGTAAGNLGSQLGGAIPSDMGMGMDTGSIVGGDTTGSVDPSSGMMFSSAAIPGIYGTDTTIEIDVSRAPRQDEYFGEPADPISGVIADVPSDVKNVSYFVQAGTIEGVQDPLMTLISGITPGSAAGLMQNAGLVRRSLDRSVLSWAYEQAQVQQINRTGQLIAPEIAALEFQYFDGLEWQVQWDSSQFGLPMAIRVTVAMQHPRHAKNNPIEPGMSLQMMTPDVQQQFGLEFYSLLVNIPGAQSEPVSTQMLNATNEATSSSSGLGF